MTSELASFVALFPGVVERARTAAAGHTVAAVPRLGTVGVAYTADVDHPAGKELASAQWHISGPSTEEGRRYFVARQLLGKLVSWGRR